MRNLNPLLRGAITLALLCASSAAFGSEADIKIPDLSQVKFAGLGGMTGPALMYLGILLCAIGAAFGLIQYSQTKALPVHESMAKVSHTIWETCKTYLFTQGKFLAILWFLIAACMVYYFGFLTDHKDDAGQALSSGHVAFNVFVILAASVLGILGSYGVAGSASGSTPFPTPERPSPRSRATRSPRWASRSAPA